MKILEVIIFMGDFVILTDSSADMSNEMVQELGIEVLPLAFTMEDKTYCNYSDNRDMSPEDFFSKLGGGVVVKTNAVNVGQAIEAMEAQLQAGRDVLALGFSSGLSTTYNSFKIASDELAEKYPEQKVYAVDTLCASLGQGMMIYLACQMQRQGKTIEEVRDWVEENKLRVCHWVTVDDLMYLKRGGRVSAATAMVGTVLHIKPIIHVDNEGRLANVAKTRGRKASLDFLVNKVGETGTNPAEQVIFISHSHCLADAEYVASEIKRKYGTLEFKINYIGPVIGAHTGPGCVALFFLGSER